MVDDILLVSDETIRATVSRLYVEEEWVVEPSGAVPLAALIEHGLPCPLKRVGVIFSGGNVDIEAFLATS